MKGRNRRKEWNEEEYGRKEGRRGSRHSIHCSNVQRVEKEGRKEGKKEGRNG
jgi:hypothetical protein